MGFFFYNLPCKWPYKFLYCYFSELPEALSLHHRRKKMSSSACFSSTWVTVVWINLQLQNNDYNVWSFFFFFSQELPEKNLFKNSQKKKISIFSVKLDLTFQPEIFISTLFFLVYLIILFYSLLLFKDLHFLIKNSSAYKGILLLIKGKFIFLFE